MWIFLLDHSGSMRGSFGGNLAISGRPRVSETATKLEAAKKALLTDLRTLDASTRVVFMGFTEQASMVFEGRAGQTREIQDRLDRLRAEGGTSIGDALDFAAGYLASYNRRPEVHFAVVVSDGLSAPEPARAAAERLLAAGATVVFVILIDPTEEGWQVARAIAIGRQAFVVQ